MTALRTSRLAQWLAGLWLAALLPPIFGAEDDRAAERARMVQEQLSDRGKTRSQRFSAPLVSGQTVEDDYAIRNPAVLEAMRSVPRHWFVPEQMQREAYSDRPLPIGFGQTISQPYIVALMTELLAPKPGEKILEVGTGSGYQAAILSKFTPEVYTIEIVQALQKEAAPRLQKFDLGPDRVLHGDGYFGLEKAAPFDGILVTAAADHIPPPLIQQLRPGGRMIIPIGAVHATQRLVVVQKDESGKVRSRSALPVRFVPLTGGPKR